MKQLESVVFFGKGGIGKSTLASNVSVVLAAGGGKVLHVGCDPKMDSTLGLAGSHIPPFNGAPGPDSEARLRGFIRPAAVKGVNCVEAGGPQAGLGCAGAGIGALLETIKDSAILEKDGYTAAVFDVLGDVVCGGFAAPLRRGFAKKVVIVTSEEPLSLYSANRLIAMVRNYARNGVYLAGLAVNCKDPAGGAAAEAFAAAVNTRVLGVIRRDPAVQEAERRRVPAVLAAPKSDFARELVRLTRAIAAAGPQADPPIPLSDAEFGLFAAGRAAARPRPAPKAARGARPRGGVAEAFRAAGLTPAGLEGGQIVCDWAAPAGLVKVVLSPAGPATSGQLHFSDWAACLHPASDPEAAGKADLKAAVGGLAGFRFDQLLGFFGVESGFHGAIGALGMASGFSDYADKGSTEPRRPHLGSGQWHRFFFPSGSSELALPPDMVVMEHGDSECRFCDSPGGPLGLFGGRADSVPDLAKARPNVFSTGLGQREALLGDEKLVKESLEAAAASAGPGGLVEFYSTCAPLLLAGDTDSAVRAAAGRTGAVISRQNYNSYEEYSESRAAARSALILRGLERGRKAGAKPRFDAALYGYGRLAAPLCGLLAQAGVGAAPETEDFYGPLLAAKLLVLRGRDEALCPALDKAGIPWTVPPAPYGFAGTKAWAAAVFKALGRRLPAAALPSREQASRAGSLRRLAGKYRIGLVTPAAEIEGITEGRLAEGLGLAAESGFGFDLLVYLEGKAGRPAALRAAAALGKAFRAGNLRTRFFSAPGELERLLAARGGPDLVYSDLRRDPRALAAGKNSFSSLIFEPGYEGALESVRRLLELCEWKFSARYLAAGPGPAKKERK